MSPTDANLETLSWLGCALKGHLVMIDQTLLPGEIKQIECRDVSAVWEAIKMLRVRGAPAIGIAAAYGYVIGLQSANHQDEEQYFVAAGETMDYLASSRPTAVNLFWALNRMDQLCQSLRGEMGLAEITARMLEEAQAIHQEDREMCRAIGRFGADMLSDEVQGVLTHCNAGGLATAEYGTALSVLFTAHDLGNDLHVFVDETRPLLQGARLTAWELMQRGIQATLICDSMAAQVMKEGRIQAVITGADRIASNGDAANKIGTYSIAVLARAHGIPFYVAAPSSTFDLSLMSGDEIPIEERHPEEITHGFGRQTAPPGIQVYNPAFDVTPADLIDAIITEKGVIQPVNRNNIIKTLQVV